MKEYVEAGRIVNTHGVTGEVKIEVWLDSPEYFRSFKRLYLNGAEKKIGSSRRGRTSSSLSRGSRAWTTSTPPWRSRGGPSRSCARTRI